MTQFEKVLAENPGHQVDEQDAAVTVAVIRSLALGLFHMQVSGMVKFPGGPFTIGEIESNLDGAAAAFTQKLIESKPK